MDGRWGREQIVRWGFWSPVIANEKETKGEMVRGENTTLKAEVGWILQRRGCPGAGSFQVASWRASAWDYRDWRKSLGDLAAGTSIRLSHHDLVHQEN